MSFSNEHFQIFFNKVPVSQDNTISYQSPIQSLSQNTNTLEHVKRFTLSTGGIYQDNKPFFSTDSLENHTYNTASPSHMQAIHNDGTAYSSGQVTDSGSHEALDYSDGYQVPAHRDTEDDEDREEGLGLSSNSRKIKKDKLNPQGRTFGSKKAMLDAYKIKTKRNPWQPEEDEQVIDLVSKYGQSWALIASLMKLRSGKQIRDRYLNKLKPDINKGEWTNEEDEKLMILCRKMGHKWSRIATQLPGRTEGQVKNRFYSHVKKRMPNWNGIAEGSSEEDNDEERCVFDDEEDMLKQLQSESPLVKEEMMFGLGKDIKATQKPINSIQSLNCAGNYKITSHNEEQEYTKGPQMSFGSLNIRINTFNQPSTAPKRDEETFCQAPAARRVNMNVKTGYNRYDPTDVISYDNVGNMSATEGCSTADEIRSPFSAQTNNMYLSSTRASSFQDKEFEEVFGRMGNNVTKFQPVTAGKSNMISFSITNGNIQKNPSSAAGKMINFRGAATGTLDSMVKMEGSYGRGLKEVNQLDFSSGSSKINLKIC